MDDQTDENNKAQRWQERFGDPRIKRDVIIGAKAIQMGDEIFDFDELEKEPLVCTHPFKAHHYDLQKELEKIRAYYAKFPERKMIK